MQYWYMEIAKHITVHEVPGELVENVILIHDSERLG